jgi:hypothetical protein
MVRSIIKRICNCYCGLKSQDTFIRSRDAALLIGIFSCIATALTSIACLVGGNIAFAFISPQNKDLQQQIKLSQSLNGSLFEIMRPWMTDTQGGLVLINATALCFGLVVMVSLLFIYNTIKNSREKKLLAESLKNNKNFISLIEFGSDYFKLKP